MAMKGHRSSDIVFKRSGRRYARKGIVLRTRDSSQRRTLGKELSTENSSQRRARTDQGFSRSREWLREELLEERSSLRRTLIREFARHSLIVVILVMAETPLNTTGSVT
jgi:hypothetical protein